jgi:glycosyltransferase involved in cell wall biosynthesis
VWSLNRFQTITTPSHQLAELVANWGVKTQVVVIPNGIRITEIKQSIKEYDVVTLSRLVSWKNVGMVIGICKTLKLKLGVIGSGPDEANLRTLAVDGNVEFLGELGYEDAMTTLSKSRIFALLSSYEGLSHSLLEAMGMEIPVIVSNAPGNTSVIRTGENGLVVNLEDHSGAATSFQKLISDSDYADSLARNAKQDVLTLYNQDVQLEHFINLLRV